MSSSIGPYTNDKLQKSINMLAGLGGTAENMLLQFQQ
jgi:hypothetical protein